MQKTKIKHFWLNEYEIFPIFIERGNAWLKKWHFRCYDWIANFRLEEKAERIERLSIEVDCLYGQMKMPLWHTSWTSTQHPVIRSSLPLLPSLLPSNINYRIIQWIPPLFHIKTCNFTFKQQSSFLNKLFWFMYVCFCILLMLDSSSRFGDAFLRNHNK